MTSVFTLTLGSRGDAVIADCEKKTQGLEIPSAHDLLLALRPSGTVISRDSAGLGGGLQSPPHLGIQAEVLALRQPARLCTSLATIAREASAHLQRRTRYGAVNKAMGNTIFIGHGRSSVWRELKDFIQDRLKLPWDEFNRLAVAGVTTTERLSQMLDEAAVAMLVLTAEDERADGTLQPRLNVVHEAGLFQGRLGFSRAIILLEEGCNEFSNVQGLTQLRFPKGEISAKFEEIRRVLEREGLL